MKSKLLIAVLLFGLASCSLYDEMITDWYYTSDELEKWLVDTTQFRFEMVDQYGITREFVNRTNSHGFSESTGYIAFIKDQQSNREYFYQQFQSNYNDNFSIGIDPETNSFIGEQISFSFADMDFTYDLLIEKVVRGRLNNQFKTLNINSEGIQEDSLFKSKFEIITNFETSNQVYEKVFHFHLADFESYWTPTTITDIYFAQKIGLIQYNVKNGQVLKRK